MNEISDESAQQLKADFAKFDRDFGLKKERQPSSLPVPTKPQQIDVDDKRRILAEKLTIGSLEGTPETRPAPAPKEKEYTFGEDALEIAREAGLDIENPDDVKHLLTLIRSKGDF